MEVFDAILKRRSCRKFSQEEISDENIKLLLQSAMAAPSACNKRPWMFYVVKNKDLQLQLRKASPYTDKNSSLIIIVAGDDKRSLGHRVNDFWIQDASAAVENMLLTATDLGIGSCWCGLFPMVTPVKRVRRILNLEEHIIPMAMVHLGYPDEDNPPRTQYDEKRIVILE